MPVNHPELLAKRASDGEPSDRELLERFEAEHDENAFAAILRRHGPMVLQVCQRILERREDAEDTFQATFLVLARKAGKVSWHDSIASWLHATAHRLASELRRKRVRLQIRESRHVAPAPGDALEEVSSRELLAILDEELINLPEECRGPLLLCCMEGMTGDEAANQLGCSPSTVKRRLRDARELLLARLTRRGISLSMTAMIALLAADSALASLPANLAAATVQAAALFKSGASLPAGLVSANAIQLTRSLLPLLSAKAKIAVGLLLAAVVAIAVVAGRGGAAQETREPIAAAVPNKKAAEAEFPMVKRGNVPAVRATVETTLRTEGPFIRQYAFDGNPNSCFVSADDPRAADHFTLIFDNPVSVNSISVKTGAPNDTWLLEGGQLEVSADGVAFEPLAAFANGAARGNANGRRLLAVRIQPAAQKHPLVIRELAIDSGQPVATFHHPVEFVVDASATPEMVKWAHRAAKVCEHAYPMICEELAAEGFRPPSRIPLVVRHDARALAAASDGRIILSAGYFEANPQDIGAVIHATSYVVQAYQGHGTPNWLVHGIADYIRYFKFEPGTLDPANPLTARYDGDSRETAAFLAYLAETYDPTIVRKLNATLRDGKYTDDIWITLTQKPLRELGEEWRSSLRH